MEELYTNFILILASTVRLSVPLLFACLAGLYSERSGVFDIGLEGKMLVARLRRRPRPRRSTGSAWLGLARRRSSPRSLFALRPRLRLDHPARQPDRLRRRHQLPRLRPDRACSAMPGSAQGGRTPQLAERGALHRRSSFPSPSALARRAGHRPALCRPHLRPQHPRLSRLPRRAGDAGGSSTARASACASAPSARIRRRSTPPAFRSTWLRYRAADLRRHSLRLRRRLSVDRPVGRLHPRHDGRQGLHRARRADLRQMAAGAGDVHLPPLRLPRCRRDPPAGRQRAR